MARTQEQIKADAVKDAAVNLKQAKEEHAAAKKKNPPRAKKVEAPTSPAKVELPFPDVSVADVQTSVPGPAITGPEDDQLFGQETDAFKQGQEYGVALLKKNTALQQEAQTDVASTVPDVAPETSLPPIDPRVGTFEKEKVASPKMSPEGRSFFAENPEAMQILFGLLGAAFTGSFGGGLATLGATAGAQQERKAETARLRLEEEESERAGEGLTLQQDAALRDKERLKLERFKAKEGKRRFGIEVALKKDNLAMMERHFRLNMGMKGAELDAAIEKYKTDVEFGRAKAAEDKARTAIAEFTAQNDAIFKQLGANRAEQAAANTKAYQDHMMLINSETLNNKIDETEAKAVREIAARIALGEYRGQQFELQTRVAKDARKGRADQLAVAKARAKEQTAAIEARVKTDTLRFNKQEAALKRRDATEDKRFALRSAQQQSLFSATVERNAITREFAQKRLDAGLGSVKEQTTLSLTLATVRAWEAVVANAGVGGTVPDMDAFIADRMLLYKKFFKDTLSEVDFKAISAGVKKMAPPENPKKGVFGPTPAKLIGQKYQETFFPGRPPKPNTNPPEIKKPGVTFSPKDSPFHQFAVKKGIVIGERFKKGGFIWELTEDGIRWVDPDTEGL